MFDKFKFQNQKEPSIENENPTAAGGWKWQRRKALTVRNNRRAKHDDCESLHSASQTRAILKRLKHSD